jgi:putative acetyltransferase
MESLAIQIRAEAGRDRDAVHDLLARAFGSDAEAELVAALRGRTEPQVSLVAELAGGGVVGHILFTPVEIRADAASSHAIGLGPLAVSPPQQRLGVGAMLVEAGLAACAAIGEPVVVVLGHADYYPRFGFQPAWSFGLYYGAPGPNPAFMVRELAPGALRGRSGEVVYHAAFDSL